MATDDAWMDNPVFADRDLTLHSTYEMPPEPPPPPIVPPIVGEIIGNLGLRYRPSGQADLVAHAEALKLLSQDVADIPPPLLDAAAKHWVRESKFMPRASELRELARNLQSVSVIGSDIAGRQLQEHCDRLNALNEGRDGWHVVGKAPKRTIATRRDKLGMAAP